MHKVIGPEIPSASSEASEKAQATKAEKARTLLDSPEGKKALETVRQSLVSDSVQEKSFWKKYRKKICILLGIAALAGALAMFLRNFDDFGFGSDSDIEGIKSGAKDLQSSVKKAELTPQEAYDADPVEVTQDAGAQELGGLLVASAEEQGINLRTQSVILGAEVVGPAGGEITNYVVAIGDTVVRGQLNDPQFTMQLEEALRTAVQKFPAKSPHAPELENVLMLEHQWNSNGLIEGKIRTILDALGREKDVHSFSISERDSF